MRCETQNKMDTINFLFQLNILINFIITTTTKKIDKSLLWSTWISLISLRAKENVLQENCYSRHFKFQENLEEVCPQYYTHIGILYLTGSNLWAGKGLTKVVIFGNSLTKIYRRINLNISK